MTPTGAQLKARLDARRRWFDNEWFFKWHFIGKDGPVTMDSFDGREIHYSGIAFSGSARLVYWDAVVRGVKKEIDEQFDWIDEHVRRYKHETALEAIDQCVGQLISFVRIIRRKAVAKDRILRGDGINFPSENDAGRWEGTSSKEIIARGEALKVALPLNFDKPNISTDLAQKKDASPATEWWHQNQGWLGPLGILLAAISIVLVFLI